MEMTTPASSLTPVVDYPVAGQDGVLYLFEGEAVHRTKAKLTSASGLDIDDAVFRVDDVVRFVVEARISGVDHKIAADGKIERVHTAKAVDAVVIDWDLDITTLRPAAVASP